LPNELIDLRGAHLKALTDWMNDTLIAPVVAECRANGMKDEEINLLLNQLLFDAFKGLHGFPDSHRPK